MELLQPSFSRGEVSPLAATRVDQQFYGSALKTLRNFIVRTEGGVSNRGGTQFCFPTKFTTAVKFVDFVYNNQQTYELEFGDHYVRFAVMGALIMSGGVPYELATPYAASDLPLLRWTQSADTLTLAHPSYTPYQLKRLTAVTFSLIPMPFKNGPFLPVNTDLSSFVWGVYVAPPAGWPPAITGYQTPPTGTGVVQLNSTKPIFNVNQVGALFYVEQQDLSTVAPWEPRKILTLSGGGEAQVIGLLRRNDGKTYICPSVIVPAALTIATGTFSPVHTDGVAADGDGTADPSYANSEGVNWLYLDSGFGIVQILSYVSTTQVIAQELVRLPAACMGGPTAVQGPWAFTGDGTTVAFGPLTSNTSTDPSKYVVSVNGVIQDNNAYTVTAAGGNITFVSAPVTGAAIVAKQVAALGQSYYWAFGAWSQDQGFPSTVTYYQDRLTFGGAPTNPQAFWMSKSSNYPDFGVSVPSVDSDALTFKLNARQNNAVLDLIPLTDLVVGTASIIWRVWGGAAQAPLTPSNIDAKAQNFYGHSGCPAVLYADSAIYVTNGGRKIRDLIYTFQFDKYVGDELTVLARHLIPKGVDIVRMAYAPEPFEQLYAVRSDGILLSLTYVREQQIIGWSHFDTQGTFVDVVVVPENSSYTTYVTTQRTVNGVLTQFFEKFMPREYQTLADGFFVDAGLTYDGRNASTVTVTLTGGMGSTTTSLVSDPLLTESGLDLLAEDGTPLITEGGFLVTTQAPGWSANCSVTMTFSSVPPNGGFGQSMVTNKDEIWIYDAGGVDADGDPIAPQRVRIRITGVTSNLVATGLALTTVPLDLQNTPSAVWTIAKTQFSGLDYLNGMTVSIYADGSVVKPQTVVGGAIALTEPGGVVHAGLGYVSDFETLSMNVSGQPTIRAKPKTIPRMSLIVDQSQGFMVGPDDEHLNPAQLREFENWDEPTGPYTDIEHVYASTTLDDNGHVFVRNVDPSPLTILGVIPRVEVGMEA